MKLFFPFFLTLALVAGCTAIDTSPTKLSQDDDVIELLQFAPVVRARPIYRSNADIAAEFMEFSFKLETGQKIAAFSRFDGPIIVAFTAPAPPSLTRDLNRLVARFRSEVGLNIRVGTPGQNANIYINRISGRQLRATLPGAACFVTPNVRNLGELRRNKRTTLVDWTKLNQRTIASVFLPDDGSPQEGRDCLHEEIAQALGPVNDLFRVPDTIFNDDNMHVVLTAYDMLLLRITYAPELRNGMSPQQVARQLPAIVNRLNPSGIGYAAKAEKTTDPEWRKAIFGGLLSISPDRKRLNSINKAVSLARTNNYKANRLAFSYFSRGHILSQSDPEAAANDFRRAHQIYSQSYGVDSIQAAQAAIQLASYSYTTGDMDSADKYLRKTVAAAKRTEDATLLFRALALQSAILNYRGKTSEAIKVRRQAESWAYYALGRKPIIARIFARIDAISPAQINES